VDNDLLSADLPPRSLFEALAVKHGHYCPMSTLGLRLGWAARKRLDGKLLSAAYAAATCAADGIRLAFETENLSVTDLGLHRLCWVDSFAHHRQIELTPMALELAASYRTFTSENERELLLDNLRTADESMLFIITETGFD